MPASSRAQQQAMSIAEHHPEEATGAAKEMARSMSKKTLHEFAATKTEGLPEHVKKSYEEGAMAAMKAAQLGLPGAFGIELAKPLIGAGIGAAAAPSGERWRGAGRGAITGAGVSLGGNIAGGLGAIPGALAGSERGAMRGAAAAGMLGAVGGGFGAHALAAKLLPYMAEAKKQKEEQEQKAAMTIDQRINTALESLDMRLPESEVDKRVPSSDKDKDTGHTVKAPDPMPNVEVGDTAQQMSTEQKPEVKLAYRIGMERAMLERGIKLSQDAGQDTAYNIAHGARNLLGTAGGEISDAAHAVGHGVAEAGRWSWRNSPAKLLGGALGSAYEGATAPDAAELKTPFNGIGYQQARANAAKMQQNSQIAAGKNTPVFESIPEDKPETPGMEPGVEHAEPAAEPMWKRMMGGAQNFYQNLPGQQTLGTPVKALAYGGGAVAAALALRQLLASRKQKKHASYQEGFAQAYADRGLKMSQAPMSPPEPTTPVNDVQPPSLRDTSPSLGVQGKELAQGMGAGTGVSNFMGSAGNMLGNAGSYLKNTWNGMPHWGQLGVGALGGLAGMWALRRLFGRHKRAADEHPVEEAHLNGFLKACASRGINGDVVLDNAAAKYAQEDAEFAKLYCAEKGA